MFLIDKIKLKLFQHKFRLHNKNNFCSIKNFCNIDKIFCGDNSYGEIDIVDYSQDKVKLIIGSYCSIAKGVKFLLGGEHQVSSFSTYPLKVKKFGFSCEAFSKGDIILQDDVWIGENAIICSGVTIGQGAIIAAGAVVTKSVEPYAIVGGNPAKLIKFRIEQELRDRLININIKKILDEAKEEQLPLLYSKLTQDILLKILKEEKNHE